jgi:predicted nucleic acid-binding Zn ribbon protein
VRQVVEPARHGPRSLDGKEFPMTEQKGEPPPLVQKERKRGTELAIAAILLLILLALFLLYGDGLFAPDPVEETNMVVEVEPGG